MTIALIAALGKDNVIGRRGDLPWHFPSDFKFFKETTSGHTVLMGRVTYQSILRQLGKPLPNRRHIVLTRDQDFKDGRVTIIHHANDIKKEVKPGEMLFVIGGAQVYEQTLPLADLIYLTHIDISVPDGDAFFPRLDPRIWSIIEEKSLVEKATNLRFCTYKRLTTV